MADSLADGASSSSTGDFSATNVNRPKQPQPCGLEGHSQHSISPGWAKFNPFRQPGLARPGFQPSSVGLEPLSAAAESRFGSQPSCGGGNAGPLVPSGLPPLIQKFSRFQAPAGDSSFGIRGSPGPKLLRMSSSGAVSSIGSVSTPSAHGSDSGFGPSSFGSVHPLQTTSTSQPGTTTSIARDPLGGYLIGRSKGLYHSLEGGLARDHSIRQPQYYPGQGGDEFLGREGHSFAPGMDRSDPSEVLVGHQSRVGPNQPDLSHLTMEERAIIENVLQRQQNEETKEVEFLR